MTKLYKWQGRNKCGLGQYLDTRVNVCQCSLCMEKLDGDTRNCSVDENTFPRFNQKAAMISVL